MFTDMTRFFVRLLGCLFWGVNVVWWGWALILRCWIWRSTPRIWYTTLPSSLAPLFRSSTTKNTAMGRFVLSSRRKRKMKKGGKNEKRTKRILKFWVVEHFFTWIWGSANIKLIFLANSTWNQNLIGVKPFIIKEVNGLLSDSVRVVVFNLWVVQLLRKILTRNTLFIAVSFLGILNF